MTVPRLNLPLVLEARTEVADGAGGLAGHWSALGTLWGMLIKGSGREHAETGQPIGRLTTYIIVRAAPYGATTRPVSGQRLRSENRVFAIEAVGDWDQSGRYLRCFAKEEQVQ